MNGRKDESIIWGGEVENMMYFIEKSGTVLVFRLFIFSV